VNQLLDHGDALRLVDQRLERRFRTFDARRESSWPPVAAFNRSVATRRFRLTEDECRPLTRPRRPRPADVSQFVRILLRDVLRSASASSPNGADMPDCAKEIFNEAAKVLDDTQR
jgi:hypothetical protein